ncbi:MAG: helix-turn-helix transcriptional regulator [Chloroflexi bacterium]|nr:helix-turn-helix transcriptional regulator [Chloroflexota bacterium]
MRTKHRKSTRGDGTLNIELRPRADESLGVYIRRIRLVRGMGLTAVADATPKIPESRHVSYSYLSQIELGRALRPSRERLLSIAEALGLPPEWLLEKAGFAAGVETTLDDDSVPSPLVQQIALRAGKLDRTDQEAFLQMIDSIVRLRHARRDAGARGAKS